MAPEKAQQVAIERIVRDPALQMRARTDVEAVNEFRAAMKEGAEFPPVDVFQEGEGGELLLASGFHRVEAAEAAGIANIDAVIRPGGRRDAILFACGTNTDHGVRRTNEDKRRAVGKMLDDAEWSEWSNRKIADHCSVVEGLVRIIKKERTAAAGTKVPRKRTGAYSTQRPTGTITKPPSAAKDAARVSANDKALGLFRQHVEPVCRAMEPLDREMLLKDIGRLLNCVGNVERVAGPEVTEAAA